MSFFTLIVTAIGLAADAFAVAVGRGMRWPRFAWRPAVAIAVTFGAFQGLMPLLGWVLGNSLTNVIVDFDHWLAFGLLLAIGVKMAWEALRDFRTSGEDAVTESAATRPATGEAAGAVARVRPAELLTLGVATSIDALAVGVSFAVLEVSIVLAAVVIAAITAAMSVAGVAIGHHAGRHLRSYAELAGAAVLVGIGVTILLEHMSA